MSHVDSPPGEEGSSPRRRGGAEKRKRRAVGCRFPASGQRLVRFSFQLSAFSFLF
jgi:hypothetical protein